MAAIQTAEGSFTPSLLLAMALMVLSIVIVAQLKDPQFQDDSGEHHERGTHREPADQIKEQ